MTDGDPNMPAPLSRRSTFMSRWDIINKEAADEEEKMEQNLRDKKLQIQQRKGFRSSLFTSTRRSVLQISDVESMHTNDHNDDRNDEGTGKIAERILSKFFLLHNGFIHPSSVDVLKWYAVDCIAICYVLFFAPWDAAFLEWSLQPGLVRVSFDMLVSIICVVHVILHYFFVGVVHNRTRNADISSFRRNYVLGWFFCDICGCIPCQLILKMSNIEPSEELGAFRTMTWLRILKGFHVINIEQALSTEHFHLTRGLRRLIATLIFIPLISHVVACQWFLASNFQRDENSWVNGEEMGFLHLSTTTPLSFYVASIYWAVSTVTTVGFGDIVAQNTTEHIYSIVCCVAGAVLGGAVIAETANIVVEWDEAKHKMEMQMSSIRAYLAFRKIPKDLQLRIVKHFKVHYRRRATFNELEILNSLTMDLRRSLSLNLLQNTLQQLDIFRDIKDSSMLASVLRHLRPMSFEMNENIINQGDPVFEIFFIVDGEVDILERHGEHVLARLGSGNHFGEFASIDGKTLNQLHLNSVRAVCKTDLFCLSLSDLEDLASKFPIVKDRLKKFSTRKKRVLELVEEDIEADEILSLTEKIALLESPHKRATSKRRRLVYSGNQSLVFASSLDEQKQLFAVNSHLAKEASDGKLKIDCGDLVEDIGKEEDNETATTGKVDLNAYDESYGQILCDMKEIANEQEKLITALKEIVKLRNTV